MRRCDDFSFPDIIHFELKSVGRMFLFFSPFEEFFLSFFPSFHFLYDSEGDS